MNHHVKDYYCQYSDGSSKGRFHKVIPLNESPDIDWTEVYRLVPDMGRGWFELSHLSQQDRIDFNRDFWISKLPYHPKMQEFLTHFFDSLDNIVVFLVQKKFDDPYEAHLVYSLKDNEGFYKGQPGISEEGMVKLQSEFSDVIFPQDYIAFLQIHNGFCKTVDCTGITRSTRMRENYKRFQEPLTDSEVSVIGVKDRIVNPKSLIPFYESFGMPFYQCFWGEWYPENEMGNVYFSSSTKTISDVKAKDPGSEMMAFPTFLDWLMFYLETVR